MTHNKTFFEVFTELLAVTTLAEWKDKCEKFTRLLGFDMFLYGTRSERAGDGQAVISTYPASWREQYDSNRYVLHDPTVGHCIRSFLPLIWKPSLFRTPKQQEIYEQACEHGIRSGVSIPIHGFRDKPAMVSFATDERPTEERYRAFNGVLPELNLLVAYMHEAFTRLEPEEERPKLTPRERECLKWIAAGKTTWEVSRIMSCTERTITFHVSNITSKLGVTNRQHAVARAVSLSLID